MCPRNQLWLVCLAGLIAACTGAGAEVWSTLDVDSEAVYVFRDGYGVAHISAQSSRGLYYTMGYVVAQDRLAQLDTNRRYAEGRLAETLGATYAISDMVHRRDYYTDAERLALFQALRPETQTILQDYADGINAHLAEALADPDHKLPKELWDAGGTMAPWSVMDSVACIQVIMRRFGERGGNELANQEQLDLLGQTDFDQQYPINNHDAPTTIPPGEDGHFPDALPVVKAHETAVRVPFRTRPCPVVTHEIVAAVEEERDLVSRAAIAANFPLTVGSYAAMVGPPKATSGHAYLFACPYMRFNDMPTPPQTVNEIDLKGPAHHVAGVNITGMPCVFIGHNDALAWSITSSRSDNVDTYIEKLNPANQHQYWYNGQWVTMTSRDETVKVRGEADRTYTLYWSVHGPIFDFDLANNQAFAWKRTFFDKELDGFEALLDINRAASLAQWHTAVGHIPVSLNFHYAGVDANIAYSLAGCQRVLPPDLDPRLPLWGAGEEEWVRLREYSELPQAANPTQHYLANFNNKPAVWWDNGDIGWFAKTDNSTPLFQIFDSVPTLSFVQFSYIPQVFNTHGTYEQVIELAPPFDNAQNITPPGQSGFTDKNGVPSVHSSDQDTLYANWQRKPFLFLTGPSAELAVDFTVDRAWGKPPLAAAFLGQATATAQEIIDWRWDFGDSTSAEGNFPNIIHVYAVEGQYTVSLTVTTLYSSVTATRQALIVVSQAFPANRAFSLGALAMILLLIGASLVWLQASRGTDDEPEKGRS